jgi:tripartite-type tricarboxylate transporter receptor subunit TctC
MRFASAPGASCLPDRSGGTAPDRPVGAIAPGTTPPELIQAIHAAFAAELRSERVRARFAAFVRAEAAKWGQTIHERGIRAE